MLRSVSSGGTPDRGSGRSAELLHELIAGHDRFPSLFNEAPDAMALFDVGGSLVRANRAGLELFGLDLAAVSERRYGRYLARDQVGQAVHAFSQATNGSAVQLTLRLPVLDGDAHDVDISLAPALVDAAIAGVYATLRLAPDDESSTRRLQTLASLFGNHGDAVFALDETGRCVDVNAACTRLTGYSADELYGRSYASLVAPDERLGAYDVFERALRGESVSAATAILHRDGRRIEIAGMSVPIVVDLAVVGVYVIGRDVTEQSLLEAALREQTERIRELYLVAASSGQSADAQIVTALERGFKRLGCDAGYVARIEDGVVTYLSVAGDAPHAPGDSHPLERSLHRTIVEAHRPVSVDDTPSGDVHAFIGTPIDVGGLFFGTLCLVSARRRETPFGAADRDFVRLIGALVASAIERDAQRKRLDGLAFYDQLTGLPNRTLLHDRLQQSIASAERHGSAFALHYYDLDGFKAINDTHGHMSGDDVLRTIARRFERVARQEDTVARIGGDEFVVLQPYVRSRADVESLAKRIRSAVGESIVVEGLEYRLTASAGVALYPDDGREGAALLARADAALYRVKHSGRDDVAFVSSAPPS